MVTIIVAASDNNVIGNDNKLLWSLPNDLKRFKALTDGNYIIMGRKTFESLPGKLPNRKHIIITKQLGYVVDDCIVVNSIEQALSMCDNNGFIIGGGEIYRLGLKYADKVELTVVHTVIDGDTTFPDLEEDWEVIENINNYNDEKHCYHYTYKTLIKK